MRYAKVIIDISADQVDRAFTYKIPAELESALFPGVRVEVPFGAQNRPQEGVCIEILGSSDYDPGKLKFVTKVVSGSMDTEGELVSLAVMIAGEYGSTLSQALKTVLPVKSVVRKNRRRSDPVRSIESGYTSSAPLYTLNSDQQRVITEAENDPRPSLIYGITGSGKTLCYIELIRRARKRGEASIVLIPEISLTYQTVGELTRYLGEKVSVLHSKLSAGERYEQYQRARNSETDVMVGPRSALFAPFGKLGLIIIDEEHERSYHSDQTPKYDARWVAKRRAEISGAKLILGSATPSLESYAKALEGTYALHTLTKRAVQSAVLPKVHVADMRSELSSGNRSVFSGLLHSMIADRLSAHEQVILFLNRRGYANVVSCRSCGHVIKCPHCDVALTAHNSWYTDPVTHARGAALSCHYCGYTIPMPGTCPDCGSRFIAPFGTGTEKLEQQTKKIFPEARVIRMDADTTKNKGSYEDILKTFREGRADILIGTQMIVKGHDFPRVTLVGIVLADISLYTPEYDASERTFQLITQAAGRSGRGSRAGDVVIQSYEPSHYAIEMAATQNYPLFFEREYAYRKLLSYPPVTGMLSVSFSSPDEDLTSAAADFAADFAFSRYTPEGATLIGPCNERIYRLKDRYRKILYIKHPRHDIILLMRAELLRAITERFQKTKLSFGFDMR